jgi:hypothetical protein
LWNSSSDDHPRSGALDWGFQTHQGPGLMDKTGSINTITTPVRNMLKLLYSLPPGQISNRNLKEARRHCKGQKRVNTIQMEDNVSILNFGILKAA